jgi:hypothetical protein
MVGGRARSKVAMVGGGTRNRGNIMVDGRTRNKVTMIGGGTRTGKECIYCGTNREKWQKGCGRSIAGGARRNRG